MNRTRREFLTDVGTGMLIAGIGAELANDLGLGSVLAADPPEKLTFGEMEPLVCMMQETPADKLLPRLVEKMRDGADLKKLVAAAALANARTFGGEDYVGFHTMMALAPAYHMAKEMPEGRQPLPIFKVLYRNSNRIQEYGGGKKEVLHPVKPGTLPEGKSGGDALRDAVHRKDMTKADQTFAALAKKSAEDAFNDLLIAVQECQEVHRVVLPHRAWALLPIIGKEHALTLLRQSVHYCVKNEGYSERYQPGRTALAKLFEQHRLLGRKLGKQALDDAAVDKLSQTIFKSKPEDAAGAVAEALADGIAPDAIGEAISLAANQLVLRDEGRPKGQTAPNKPIGSVHGDGIGVHACDSANAWRNMARVSNPRNTVACLILAAYQASKDRTDRTPHSDDFLKWQPYPREDARTKVKTSDCDELLKQTEAAIKNKDQALACALVHAYGEKDFPARCVFNLLLKYAVSEDGALHAEKYYRTVSEEFASTRPAFRWRQLVALARVTASEYGLAAPGHAESCKLLKV
jgi:hypothetical protein